MPEANRRDDDSLDGLAHHTSICASGGSHDASVIRRATRYWRVWTYDRAGMIRYIVKRLLLAIPTFLGITVVTFAVVHLAPGDPAQQQADSATGGEISTHDYEQLRAYWGLDQPLYVQYGRWLGRLVTLDFGHSFFDHRPVWDKIAERLPWTLTLSVMSIVAGLILAIPIGVYSAVKKDGWFDTSVGTLLYALYSVPNYVMAMALIVLVVTMGIDWLPIGGAMSDGFDDLTWAEKLFDLAKHFVLIGVCFTYPAIAFQSRFVRGNMLEVLRQDYIRTATAKGASRVSVVVKHAFRNTLIPLISLLGLVFPTVVSGSAILEVMFNWPGAGRLMYTSIMQRDYPTVMALAVITAVLVQLGTLLADIAYAWADPRLRRDDT